MVGSLIAGSLLAHHRSQTALYGLMSVFALLASLAFWFTRKPIELDTDEQEQLVLQASQLSNLNDYFNTTRSEIPSHGGSFKATF